MSKDYSRLVGNTYNELTILSITEPLRAQHSHRNCECLCSCGRTYCTRLSKVVRGEVRSCGHLKITSHYKEDNFSKIEVQKKAYFARTSLDKPLSSNITTGIRNISYSQREKLYIVVLRRHKKTYKGRAKTLSEALQLKQEIIDQAEKDFGEKIYKRGG